MKSLGAGLGSSPAQVVICKSVVHGAQNHKGCSFKWVHFRETIGVVVQSRVPFGFPNSRMRHQE